MGWRFTMVSQIKKKTTSETKINHIIATINCNKETFQLFSMCQAHYEKKPAWV